ncbi:hypothetical protein [Propionicimonas sp.]|uniref:hypothetical protein n=1 Tax=Propionicimonas sp. TaxID=1955623 RepID=UPI0039E3AC28
MIVQFAHQIELAERGLADFPIIDPTYVADEVVPASHRPARLIRSGAKHGRRFARRLRPALRAA